MQPGNSPYPFSPSEQKTGSLRRVVALSLCMLFAILFSGEAFAITYTWTGASSTAWALAGNWTNSGGGTFPGTNAADVVIIPQTTNAPTISATPATAIASLTFNSTGTSKTLTISAGVVLTVTGAVTHNSTVNSASLWTLAGTGTLNCQSLAVGSAGTGATGSARATTFTITQVTLNITNGITLTSSNSTFANNATITHTSGTVNVGTSITTVNAAAGNTSTYTLGATAPYLKISGSTPIVKSGTGTSTLTFNGATSTVEYAANASYTFLTTPAAYANLVISGGGGTKTLAANTTATTLTVRAGTTLGLNTFTLGSPTVTLENVGGGTGASITGSGAMTLGGTLTVNYTGSGAITSGCTISCPVALGANRTILVNEDGSGTPSVDLNITGLVSGAFTLLKTGGGELKLSNANSSFSGAITVENGTLVAGANAPSGAIGAFGNATSTITLGNANTTTNNYPVGLWIDGAFTVTRTITIANQATTGGYTVGGIADANAIYAGAITYNQSFTVNQVATTGGNKLTFTGGMVSATNAAKTITFDITGDATMTTTAITQPASTGANSLVKRGNGALTLSLANAYTGNTTVSGGTLIAGANVVASTNGPFGNSANAIIMGDATTTANNANVALLTGGAFSIGRGVTVTDNATSGTYSIGGNAASTSSFTASIVISQPVSVTQVTGGTTNITGGITGGTSVVPAKLVTFDNVGAVVVSTGLISNGTGTLSLRKANSGALTLSSANTFTGSATLDAGTLGFGIAGAIGTASSLIINGGNLQNTTAAALTLTSIPQTWAGNFGLTGTQPLYMGGAITMSTSVTVTVAANIGLSNTGTINDVTNDLTKAGTGVLAFVSQAIQLHDLNISAGTFFSTSNDLSIAGDFSNSGTFTHNSGTVSFNGSGAQAVSGSSTTAFNNLNTDLGAIVTMGANATVAGTFTVNNGTSMTLGAFSFAVTGTTTIGGGSSGTLTINSATGAKTFTGDVTVAAGATWDNTAATVNIGLSGSLTNNGTFNAGNGVYTFSGTGKNINGALIIPNLTVSGTTTNNAVLTVTTALAGASTLTQGTNAILAYSGTTIVPTLAASANVNTVNYFNNGAQTVKATSYSTLILSGTGTNTKTLGSIPNIVDLYVRGTAVAVTTATMAISGDLVIEDAGDFTAAAFALTVSGNTIVGNGATGKLTISSATGTKAFNGDVTVNAGATWNNSGNAALTLPGNLSNYGLATGFTAGSGAYTFSGTNKTLSGLLIIPTVSVSGAVSNTGTLTVTTSLGGAGTLRQDPGSTLSLDAAVTITNLLAEAVGNYVNYTSASAQNIKLGNYYNLGFSGTGNKTTAAGTYNVAGTWSTSGGTALLNTNNTNLAVAGDIVGSGAITMGSGTLSVGSDWLNNGTFTANTSTVNYNGTAAQTIGAVNYNNLTVSGNKGGGAITLAAGTIGVSGTFLTSGASNIGSYVTTGNTVNFNGTGAQTIPTFGFNNITVTGSKGGNATTFLNGGTIGIAGALTVSGASNTSFVFTGSIVDYNGSGAQQIEAFNYANLSITGARGGATVSFSTTGTIGVSGIFTATASGATWSVTNSTFDYNGSVGQTIYAPFTYYALVVSNSGSKSIEPGTVVTCRTLAINNSAVITVPSASNSLVVNIP